MLENFLISITKHCFSNFQITAGSTEFRIFRYQNHRRQKRCRVGEARMPLLASYREKNTILSSVYTGFLD